MGAETDCDTYTIKCTALIAVILVACPPLPGDKDAQAIRDRGKVMMRMWRRCAVAALCLGSRSFAALQ